MKLIVSRCLLGENCKYSGGNNLNEKVLEFCKVHEAMGVCPECFGGLKIPREPSEIKVVNGEKYVFSKSGEDLTEFFKKGAEVTLAKAKEFGAELCILKQSSPSCGSSKIYDGTFSDKKIKGQGIAAELLDKNGFKLISEEDI